MPPACARLPVPKSLRGLNSMTFKVVRAEACPPTNNSTDQAGNPLPEFSARTLQQPHLRRWPQASGRGEKIVSGERVRQVPKRRFAMLAWNEI
jgi:hypothetical protein